jgi:hypothetical protein
MRSGGQDCLPHGRMYVKDGASRAGVARLAIDARESRAAAGGNRRLLQQVRMTADDFREIALSMQGAIERAHMGHPDFRVNDRIFCTLHSNDQWGMVKLTPEVQREVIRTHPKMFEPASGAWGRQGSTMVRLDVADKGTVRGAIVLAWQTAVDKPPKKPVKPRSSKSR